MRHPYCIYIAILFVVHVILLSSCGKTQHSKTSYISGKYKSEEIQYFIETAPRRHFWNQLIVKWETDIRVEICSGALSEDSLTIREIIREVTRALGNTKIYLVPSEGNLMVWVNLTKEQYIRNRGGTFPRDAVPVGFCKPDLEWLTAKIRNMKVFISPDEKGTSRANTLRHEFVHALGLNGHSNTFYNSPNLLGRVNFPSPESSMQWIDSPYVPRLDLAALSILYDTAMPTPIALSQLISTIDTTTFRHSTSISFFK